MLQLYVAYQPCTLSCFYHILQVIFIIYDRGRKYILMIENSPTAYMHKNFGSISDFQVLPWTLLWWIDLLEFPLAENSED